ncbi:MAG: PTS glucitol/sorbitol transporter subunit IIA [Ktedonobacteraceae bacterium]
MVAHSLKYQGMIQEVGSTVTQLLQFLPYEMLIFFGENAPAELRSVSLVHNGTQLVSELVAGDYLKFSPPSTAELPQPYRRAIMGERGMVDTDTQHPQWYRLTAVGESVNTNLAQLGHVVIHFDGAPTANVPGAVSVEPALEALPTKGTTFEFFGLKE